MESLPIELLRLIFSFCDLATARRLRLLNSTLADIGYEYMLEPGFSVMPWRDDVARLRAIANHDRLGPGIRSLTFNLTEIDPSRAREASYTQPAFLANVFEQTILLGAAWNFFDQLELRRRAVTPLRARDPAGLAAVLRPLLNLKHVAVTFRQPPYDIEPLRAAMAAHGSTTLSREEAIKSLNVLVVALQQASSGPGTALAAQAQRPVPAAAGGEGSRSRFRVESFSVDRLPLEVLRHSAERRVWFQCGDLFSGLTRIDLRFDTFALRFPQARVKAVNGLGYLLRKASQLTHLGLAFQDFASPLDAFILPLQELLGESGSLDEPPPPADDRRDGSDADGPPRDVFRFGALADLRLEGVACAESELRGFLLRHETTLERVQLGGNGHSGGRLEWPEGGIYLSDGTWRSLFRSLRGRMPRLQQMQLEGTFSSPRQPVAWTDLPRPDGYEPPPSPVDDAPAPAIAMSRAASHMRYEHYHFRAAGDGGRTPATVKRIGLLRPPGTTPDAFEAYVMGRIEEYPGWYQYT